jgi:hypothetical protein
MSSVVGICNSALIKIGASRITSLSDGTKNAILCNEQYEKLRDEVLQSHPWNFALKRQALGQDVTAPIFDYAYRYLLPDDCLRVLRTEDDTEHKIEGRYLLSDESTVKILYISQVTEVTEFSPIFREVLAARIACELAYSLAQSSQLAEKMLEFYEAQLRRARTFDAQEGTPGHITADSWLNSRF